MAHEEVSHDDLIKYLDNGHEQALKDDDKCLASRYESAINLIREQSEPQSILEKYQFFKANADISEAAKCFSILFDCFLSPLSKDSQQANKLGLTQTINHIREELRNLTSDLKSNYLKLKTSATPAPLVSRQSQSVLHSPMLSPRIKSNPEDRSSGRDSITKLDNQLNSTNRIIYYSQLFDNLPSTTRKQVLNFPLSETDNPLEACRLMMLIIVIFNEDVKIYGTRLLKTLLDVTSKNKNQQQIADVKPINLQFSNPRANMMTRYARSLLVLDAIPLVASIAPLSEIEIELEELFEQTLSFYSETCLESSTPEYEFNELHEGVKKTITARILGIEHNHVASKEPNEDLLAASLSLLSQKYLETLNDIELKTKLETIRSAVFDKNSFTINRKFSNLLRVISELQLESLTIEKDSDISGRSSQASSTPPPAPKTRGRPKKKQQPVATAVDDDTKRSTREKVRIVEFAFYSIVQHMFVNFMNYLKHTRSRVLINFENPLAAQIDTELTKSSSQRSSRSKSSSQPSKNDDVGPSPPKKLKESSQAGILGRGGSVLKLEQSPLFSEQSRKMDQNLLMSLTEASRCLEYLEAPENISLSKLWQSFCEAHKISDLDWFKRFTIDNMMLNCNNEKLADLLERALYPSGDDIKKEAAEASSVSMASTTLQTSVAELRLLVQLISSHVQRSDKVKTFEAIDDLLLRMKQSGLLAHDENYSSGNIILEYMVKIKQLKASSPETHEDTEESLGFLFFDTLSLMRYCADLLMDLLDRYTENSISTPDAAIGHTIVLSQFNWPKEVESYIRCIDWIIERKPRSTTPQYLSSTTKFTYPQFFQYVRNPHLIEDFMALLRQGYTLDIRGVTGPSIAASLPSVVLETSVANNSNNKNAPVNPSTGAGSTSGGNTRSSGKAITTRGTNKSFKEDLKVAMVTQMKGSNALFPLALVSEFIQSSLIPFLNNPK